MPPSSSRLPLRSATTLRWARHALADPLALLEDHAHLERKAAANALALLDRAPAPGARRPRGEGAPRRARRWARVLADVARDEAAHLRRVLGLLERRGGRLGTGHRNAYASGLRRLVRRGAGPRELVDRLLVSALIEARSAERFSVLAAASDDQELAALYAGLAGSERGHYRVFLDLAREVGPAPLVDERWAVLLEEEARLLSAQPPGPRLHSGEPSSEPATSDPLPGSPQRYHGPVAPKGRPP